MKVLIADKLEAVGRDALERAGHDVISEPSLSADALPAALSQHEPDVLVVRSTRVTAEAVQTAQRLKLIIRAGAGYDTIDVAAASRGGVFVANCPGKNAIAVAELTWGLILGCDRRLPDQAAELRQGRWNKKEYGKAAGLFGRTLGVIGMGTIAREVVSRALAFGMDVIAYSRSLTADDADELGITRAASMREVAAAADIVTIHIAATRDTQRLVDSEFIAAMKPGATLINTSRGSVIDEAALLRGLDEKQLRAGLDVYDNEPGAAEGTFESKLAQHHRVVGSHHVGASTEQAQDAIALEVARIAEVFAASGQVPNCVNRASRASATCLLTVRHKNRPGVLSKVFGVLGEARINVEEMDNVLYEGAEAACARIQLAAAPSDAQLEAIRRSCPDILSMELTQLGTQGA